VHTVARAAGRAAPAMNRQKREALATQQMQTFLIVQL
jgi:hypothetical protein